MRKAASAEKDKEQAQEGERRALVSTIRWAQVLSVDFEGEDTSLTQAQLSVLK